MDAALTGPLGHSNQLAMLTPVKLCFTRGGFVSLWSEHDIELSVDLGKKNATKRRNGVRARMSPAFSA